MRPDVSSALLIEGTYFPRLVSILPSFLTYKLPVDLHRRE